MQPSPVGRCRVLELGCGDGGNLIPIALAFPNSEFVGVDLAHTPIEIACETVNELGLANVRLEAKDILQLGPGLGQFDYIIAHGVYSWIPAAVRDKLLSIMHHHLAPQGVAYVSYNALPGCRIRQMIREMMLFHLRHVSGAQARMAEALNFLRTLLSMLPGKENSTSALMKEEVTAILDRNPATLLHDELGEFWYPVHFTDFIAHAARHGLKYLAEANIFDMEPGKFPSQVREQLENWVGGSRLDHEQYMDFLKCRKFRQTLLCHSEVSISDSVTCDRVRHLYAASAATAISAQPDLTGERPEEFRGEKGAAMVTAHPLAKVAIGYLTNIWPEAIQFDALTAHCRELIHNVAEPAALAEILLATFRAGLVELHVNPPACVSKAGPYPATTRLARWQAHRGKMITTMRHTTIDVCGELEKHFLTLLDGTRNRDALVSELASILRPPRDAAELAHEVDQNLEKLARLGLLTA
jgi:methyltransferase-like protein/2-polyprenyl-3-methyl-5-hydroxy-6-metoxy-1,4-benzoquinol methylase